MKRKKLKGPATVMLDTLISNPDCAKDVGEQAKVSILAQHLMDEVAYYSNEIGMMPFELMKVPALLSVILIDTFNVASKAIVEKQADKSNRAMMSVADEILKGMEKPNDAEKDNG